MYRSLDAARIVESRELLARRIEERFLGAGLAGLYAWRSLAHGLFF